MSSQIGYSSTTDSIVATSFQNVPPGAYGRPLTSSRTVGEQDLTAQVELPGLPSYEKWDSKDGRNERRF